MGKNLLDLGIKKMGFGYMRLPQKDGKFDIELLNQMADKYLAAGFSYFDTSPVYGMGQSESVLHRTVVERHPREAFRLPPSCLCGPSTAPRGCRKSSIIP